MIAGNKVRVCGERLFLAHRYKRIWAAHARAQPALMVDGCNFTKSLSVNYCPMISSESVRASVLCFNERKCIDVSVLKVVNLYAGKIFTRVFYQNAYTEFFCQEDVELFTDVYPRILINK